MNYSSSNDTVQSSQEAKTVAYNLNQAPHEPLMVSLDYKFYARKSKYPLSETACSILSTIKECTRQECCCMDSCYNDTSNICVRCRENKNLYAERCRFFNNIIKSTPRIPHQMPLGAELRLNS